MSRSGLTSSAPGATSASAVSSTPWLSFDHRGEVNVTWRSFQLDPNAPATSEGDPVERIAAKYGMSRATAEAAQVRVTANAATEGLDFHLDQARSGNTFDAHRLIHYAKSAGKQDTLKERLMAAYFVEGAAIGERDVLARLAVEVGLDEAAVLEVLDSDAYADDVRHDELEARQLGITGRSVLRARSRLRSVRRAAVGADPRGALQQAWTAAHPLQMVGAGDPRQRPAPTRAARSDPTRAALAPGAGTPSSRTNRSRNDPPRTWADVVLRPSAAQQFLGDQRQPRRPLQAGDVRDHGAAAVQSIEPPDRGAPPRSACRSRDRARRDRRRRSSRHARCDRTTRATVCTFSSMKVASTLMPTTPPVAAMARRRASVRLR